MLPSETFLTVLFSEESEDTSNQKQTEGNNFVSNQAGTIINGEYCCGFAAIASIVVFLDLGEQISENSDERG